MLKVIFTLDYEIHGNGDGCPNALIVEPTARMLDLFDEYGAKLTIMADVAEILKFREYRDEFGKDDYCYEAIVKQLQDAIRRGHDVQLHLHSSYFNARFENGRWRQDWSEYNFAGLSAERLNEMLRTGKEFLENTLRQANKDYRCYVFRAANWAVSPSRNIVPALIRNGFEIDTSVFKYGVRRGIVQFDYSDVPSALIPWRAEESDICRRNERGALLESPIYCERRWIGAFLSPNRIYRLLSSRAHSLDRDGVSGSDPEISSSGGKRSSALLNPFRKHAWKADFNQCTGSQLVRALNRASQLQRMSGSDSLPFVLIGHSKLFTRYNERSLLPFLTCVSSGPNHYTFSSFADLSVNSGAFRTT